MSVFDDMINFFTGAKTSDTTSDTASTFDRSEEFTKAETQSQTKQQTEQQATSVAESQNQSQTQTANTAGTGTSTTQNLDANTISLLSTLLGQGASNATANNSVVTDALSGLNSVNSAAVNRATNGLNVDALVNGVKQNAINTYDQTTARQIAQAQQQTGSMDNSFSQLLQNEGQSNLAAQLAGLETQTRLSADQQNQAALTNAANIANTTSTASNSNLNALSQLAYALKGAQTTTTQNTTQTQDSTLSSLLNNLKEGDTTSNQNTALTTNTASKGSDDLIQNTSGVSNSAGTQSASVLDFLNAFWK